MRNGEVPIRTHEAEPSEAWLDELHRKYDELVVNYPEGIEEFRHEVLSPEEFYHVFRWCAENFGYSMRLAKLEPPKSTDEVLGYSKQELYYLQQQHRWTWNDMMSFLGAWVTDQLQQIGDYPHSS